MGKDGRVAAGGAHVATRLPEAMPLDPAAAAKRGDRALGVALATGGAGLFFVVSWLPWWTISERMSPLGGGPLAPAGPGPIAPISLPLGWSLFGVYLGPHLPRSLVPAGASGLIGLAALGMLLCPFLWQRSRPRVAALAAAAYGGWALLATLLAAGDFVGLLIRMRNPVLPYGAVALGWGTAPGLWLGILALASAWVGAGRLVIRGSKIRGSNRGLTDGVAGRPPAAPTKASGRAGRPPAAPTKARGRVGQTAVPHALRTPLQLAGAGLLTLAVLLWAGGFILLPWAEANTCAGFHLTLVHFARAGCAAVDSGDAVGTVLTGLLARPGSAPLNFAYQTALTEFYAVVAAAALPPLAGAWGWATARAVRFALAAWLVVVTALGLVALRGVGLVVANPPFTGYGAWRPGIGVPVTLAALVLAWLGAALALGAARWYGESSHPVRSPLEAHQGARHETVS